MADAPPFDAFREAFAAVYLLTEAQRVRVIRATLQDAIAAGDLALVKRLLPRTRGPDILTAAVRAGSDSVVELLLLEGWQCTTDDPDEVLSYLELAAAFSSGATVERLAKHGASRAHLDNALKLAVVHGRESCVEALRKLDRRAAVPSATPQPEQVSMDPLQRWFIQTLDRRAEFSGFSARAWQSSLIALDADGLESRIGELIADLPPDALSQPLGATVEDAGALVDCTLLWMAASAGETEVCRKLIDAGAEADPVRGPRPILTAIRNERLDIVRLLLARGVTPDRRGDEPAPVVAALGASPPILQALLDSGADVKRWVDDQGKVRVPLGGPFKKEHSAALKKAARGANTRQPTTKGKASRKRP